MKILFSFVAFFETLLREPIFMVYWVLFQMLYSHKMWFIPVVLSLAGLSEIADEFFWLVLDDLAWRYLFDRDLLLDFGHFRRFPDVAGAEQLGLIGLGSYLVSGYTIWRIFRTLPMFWSLIKSSFFALLCLADVPNRRLNRMDVDLGDHIQGLLEREVQGEPGVRNVQVATPLRGLRLRKRGRWTCAFRAFLGTQDEVSVGDVIRGRWTPDLSKNAASMSASVYLAELIASGRAHVVAGGVARKVPTRVPDGEPTHTTWTVVAIGGRTLYVSMEVLYRLSMYTVFRERNRDTLIGAKARAKDIAKELAIADDDMSLMLPGTVALAMMLQRHEREADLVLVSEKSWYSAVGWGLSVLGAFFSLFD
jgi:hypothetical protein